MALLHVWSIYEFRGTEGFGQRFFDLVGSTSVTLQVILNIVASCMTCLKMAAVFRTIVSKDYVEFHERSNPKCYSSPLLLTMMNEMKWLKQLCYIMLHHVTSCHCSFAQQTPGHRAGAPPRVVLHRESCPPRHLPEQNSWPQQLAPTVDPINCSSKTLRLDTCLI